MSVSSAYAPTGWHLYLDPLAVNTFVAIGVSVTFEAEVVDQSDRPVHRAGVSVFLGQISRG